MRQFQKAVSIILLLFVICSIIIGTISFIQSFDTAPIKEQEIEVIDANIVLMDCTVTTDVANCEQESVAEAEEVVTETFCVAGMTISEEQYVCLTEFLENHEKEIIMIAQTVWGEARGLSQTKQSAVAWVILNRTQSGASIEEVLLAPNQFYGYSTNFPYEYTYELSKDVVSRWWLEQQGYSNVGRTIPSNYYNFTGDGTDNYFRTMDGQLWNWELVSPYE